METRLRYFIIQRKHEGEKWNIYFSFIFNRVISSYVI